MEDKYMICVFLSLMRHLVTFNMVDSKFLVCLHRTLIRLKGGWHPRVMIYILDKTLRFLLVRILLMSYGRYFVNLFV